MDDNVIAPPEEPSHETRRRRWPWVLALVIGTAVIVFAWSRIASSVSAKAPKVEGKSGKDSTQPIAVVAVRARSGNIGVYFNGLGTVTPIYTVTVKSRVDGQLMNIAYREGDYVQQGDQLIEIDPRPYQVQLEQAEGQLAKDQATLDNARTDLRRYEVLLQQNAIAEQLVATQRAAVAQDEGVIKADQGQIDAAKLNLTYAKITAPISGRVGLRLVDPGNIVHASDQTGLLVITQIDPISVLFTVAEDQLPVVLQKMRGGVKLSVEAYDREMKNKIAAGALTTVDNQIDQTTGTVRLRATFDNKEGILFPNQFVNARLLVEEKRGVVLIPSAAIQRTSNATFVYLVDAENKVSVKNIAIGVTEGDDSEITSGLKTGDVLVLSGADKLEDGSEVNAEIPGEKPLGPTSGNNRTKGDKQRGGSRK